MITFLFVVVTWVFFRANSVADALDFLRAMAGLSAPVSASGTVDLRDTVATLASSQATALLSLIAGTAIVFQRKNSNTYVQELSPSWVFAAGTAAALVAAVLQLSDVAPFLYFNF
jgi:alginate O-acetyltransferase complex protein AlgI